MLLHVRGTLTTEPHVLHRTGHFAWSTTSRPGWLQFSGPKMRHSRLGLAKHDSTGNRIVSVVVVVVVVPVVVVCVVVVLVAVTVVEVVVVVMVVVVVVVVVVGQV